MTPEASFVAAVDEVPWLGGAAPRRLLAADLIATALGIVVPSVEVVVRDGEVGLLREWVDGAVTLAALRRDDPRRAATVEASGTWIADRAAVTLVDHVLGTVPERDASMLLVVELGRASPHCVPVRTAACLGPVPADAAAPADALALVPWFRGAVGRLLAGATDVDADLERLLSPDERRCLAERLREVVAA